MMKQDDVNILPPLETSQSCISLLAVSFPYPPNPNTCYVDCPPLNLKMQPTLPFVCCSLFIRLVCETYFIIDS